MKALTTLLCLLSFSVVSFSQDTITKADIKIAEKFADVQFNQQEIDSMFDAVKGNINDIKRMHKLSLNNNVPMSLWQNPILPSMQFASKQEPINWNIPTGINLPKSETDLAFYSILQLSSLIKNKKITSVKLTEF